MNVFFEYFFFPLSPVLALVASGLLLILLECVTEEGMKPLKSLVALLGPILAIYFTWSLSREWPVAFTQGLQSAAPVWLMEFSKVYRLDEMSLSFFWAIGVFLLVTQLFFHSFYDKWNEKNELLILSEFIAVGMMLLVSANDLVMLFLGLELMSLPTYVIVGFRREDVRSSEAGLKYFLFGSFGTVLLLLATAILYMQFGSLKFEQINALMGAQLNQPSLLLALGLMVGAVGFKIGAAPFHMWVSDAYEGAPTSITGFMGSAVKLASFGLAIRVFGGLFLPLVGKWSTLLGWLAVLTMFVGNLSALVQTNLKRVFAYSSIAHAGFLLLGVACLSKDAANTQLIYYYLVTYGMMFLGVFAILSLLEKNGRVLEFKSLSGLGFKNPVLGIALALFALSAAGIPPTAGFFAKYFLLFEAVKANGTFFVVLAVVSNIIGIYYYLRVLVHLYMKEAEGVSALAEESPSTYLAIVVCALSVLYFAFVPAQLGVF